MHKVLIIGKNSYLASEINFEGTNLCPDFLARPLSGKDCKEYNNYDYIVNFCIQPEHFTTILPESEMIDIQIAKHIENPKTKFVFLSSRKVYGSNHILKSYKESDKLMPYDFYSENKCTIENKLQSILPDNLLILRTGNIIGKPSGKKGYHTFIGWLEAQLKQNGKVFCTIEKNTKKDYITKQYFQYALCELIENDLKGIFNVGANFALPAEDLLYNLVPKEYITFETTKNKNEQFILNCKKLHKYVKSFTEEELLQECSHVKKLFEESLNKIPCRI